MLDHIFLSHQLSWRWWLQYTVKCWNSFNKITDISNNNIYRVPVCKSVNVSHLVHILFEHVVFTVVTRLWEITYVTKKSIYLFCCAEENHDYDLFGHSWSNLGFNNWGIFWTVKTSMVSRLSLFILFFIVNVILILIFIKLYSIKWKILYPYYIHCNYNYIYRTMTLKNVQNLISVKTQHFIWIRSLYKI